jgi:hypothetical protein
LAAQQRRLFFARRQSASKVSASATSVAMI